MVESKPAQNNNQSQENYEISTTERFICVPEIFRKKSKELDQVCTQTTEINYNNPIVGVSEYDYKWEIDSELGEIYFYLKGHMKNKGVFLMLQKLDFDQLRMTRQQNFLESVENWQAFINEVDERNSINVQTLQECVDKRVKTLSQIDQRMADLYLRCKLKDWYSSRSYQFIFKDGSRSQCEKYKLKPDPWRDYIIPDGTEISTVQMMINKIGGTFNSLRFLDRNGTPILTCGQIIEDPNCLVTKDCVIKEFKLHDNQRIVGFKTDSVTYRREFHQDVQFVLMTPSTKILLLKLLANKSQVSCTSRGIWKLPEGVFREVIRQVRY